MSFFRKTIKRFININSKVNISGVNKNVKDKKNSNNANNQC